MLLTSMSGTLIWQSRRQLPFAMKPRTWPILTAAFGTLLVLIGLFVLGTLRSVTQINAELDAVHRTYQHTEEFLNEIQSEFYLSNILVRDLLLDSSPQIAASNRRQLLEIRSEMEQRLHEIERTKTPEEASIVKRLSQEMATYWSILEPVFEWPEARLGNDAAFLRNQVLPRRDAVIQLAEEIRQFNEANFRREEDKVHQRQQEFRDGFVTMSVVLLGLGLLVSTFGIVRISRLETRAEEHQRQTEQTEQELRRLSHQLVRAQEDERRSISRELHDEVGQMLTALRMELSNLEQLHAHNGSQFQEHLEASRRIAVQALNAVRDLAMGLRPSILDDLGLAPALEWQAREFSRRSGVPVAVRIQGNLDHLPDLFGTSVYRIVQEALTNCARHARPSEIEIRLDGSPEALSLTVKDDGIGFEPELVPGKGLGLIGIEERVRELGGKLVISSKPGKGTELQVSIPLSQGVRV